MHNGKCLCGKVRYSVKCDLDFVVNCHCQFCRLAHGAEFVPVAMIAADKLDILEGNKFLSKYEVANVAAFRCFCSVCGTRLFNHSPAASMISLITDAGPIASLPCFQSRLSRVARSRRACRDSFRPDVAPSDPLSPPDAAYDVDRPTGPYRNSHRQNSTVLLAGSPYPNLHNKTNPGNPFPGRVV